MKKYLISKVAKIYFIFSISLFNFNLYASTKLINTEINDSKITLNSSYIIGPGDQIKFLFYGMPEYSGGYQILNDGSLSLPFIESINLSGETLESATKLIEYKLSEEFISPKVYLQITKTRPVKISIIGEINKPGYYTLKKNSTNILNNKDNEDLVPGLPTVVDALKKAGGITKNSDLENIELMRKLPKNAVESYQTTNVNLLKLLFEGDHNQNLFLFDGDIIKIKKTNNLNLKQFQLSKANLSPGSIKVYVIGEVIKPGAQNIDSQSTLNEAIYAAGGISPKRGKLLVELYRINEDGTSTYKKFKVSPNNGYSIKKNPQLLSGDVIKVNRNFNAALGDSLEPITKPVIDVLSIFRLVDLMSD